MKYPYDSVMSDMTISKNFNGYMDILWIYGFFYDFKSIPDP